MSEHEIGDVAMRVEHDGRSKAIVLQVDGRPMPYGEGGREVRMSEAEAIALALWLIRQCAWTSIPQPERY